MKKSPDIAVRVDQIFQYGVDMYRPKPRPKVRPKPNSLDDRGREVLDPTPVLVPLRFRPATLQDQIAALEAAGRVLRQYPDDDYPDDFYGEDLEDLPGEGLSPHEIPFLMPPKPDKRRKEESPPKPGGTPPGSSGTPSGDPTISQEGDSEGDD